MNTFTFINFFLADIMYLFYIRAAGPKSSHFPCNNHVVNTIVLASVVFDPTTGSVSGLSDIFTWDETGNQAGGPNPDSG